MKALKNKIRTACALHAVDKKSLSLPKLKNLKTELGRCALQMMFSWKWVITPEANEHEFPNGSKLFSVWSVVAQPECV